MKEKIIPLSNGGVLIYGKTSLCNATAVEAGFHVGTFVEKKKGSAHLLEHTLFKKTKNRSNADVESDRSRLAHLNASTGMDFLAVKFYRTNKLLKKSLEFAYDILMNSAIDDEFFETEKGVVKQELVMCKDGEVRDVYVKNFKQALSKIKFASDIVGETSSNIDKIKFSDLLEFKDKYFVGNNFVCSVVSSLSARKIKKLVEETFASGIPQRSQDNKMSEVKAETHYKLNNVDKKSSLKIYDLEQEKVNVLVSFKVNAGEKEIFAENYNYSFLARYLSGSQGGLFLKLRNRGLIYKLDVDLASFSKNSLFDISFETSKDKITEIVDIISDDIKKIVNGSISDEHIEDYKNNLAYRDDERMPMGNQSRCHTNFTDYLSFGEIVSLDKKKRKQLREGVSKDKVTECAREIFNKDNDMFVSVLGKVEKADVPTLSKFKEKFLVWGK